MTGARRVFVLGGSGFLGRHVIPSLINRGDDVVALARTPQAADKVARLGAEPIIGDLGVCGSVDTAFRAARSEILVSLVDMGVGLVPKIADAAEAATFRRAVFISSASIETRLETATRSARVEAEARVRQMRLDWSILRPTMIYGKPDDRNMSRLLRLLLATPILPVPGSGMHLQRPVHVEDVADVIAGCVRASAPVERTYAIGGPEPMTLNAVIRLASKAVGRRPAVVHVPFLPVVSLTRVYSKLVSSPVVSVEQIERLQEDKNASIEAAIADLDFRPRSFWEGITHEARLMR